MWLSSLTLTENVCDPLDLCEAVYYLLEEDILYPGIEVDDSEKDRVVIDYSKTKNPELIGLAISVANSLAGESVKVLALNSNNEEVFDEDVSIVKWAVYHHQHFIHSL